MTFHSNITKPIPVGNVDVEIPVRRNGRASGKVKISKGAIDRMPANKSKTAYYLDWSEFAKIMPTMDTRRRAPLGAVPIAGHFTTPSAVPPVRMVTTRPRELRLTTQAKHDPEPDRGDETRGQAQVVG